MGGRNRLGRHETLYHKNQYAKAYAAENPLYHRQFGLNDSQAIIDIGGPEGLVNVENHASIVIDSVKMHMNPHRLCVAPMLDWTDRHCRYLLRLISPHTWLYTEMVTVGALLRGDRERHLAYNPEEHLVALQLGGSDPADLARCASLGEQWGYDEINLNVGCPSDRVQSGRFGACLMKEPALVADCVAAMAEAVDIPVTVKHRIGVDTRDSYEELARFVATVRGAGCRTFIIHARKAWLSGLSPKENREIPPLMYDYVYRIKRDFPQSTIIVNGGVRTVEETHVHLQHTDGVMLGREAYRNPWILAQLEAALWEHETPDRRAITEAYMAYIQREMTKDVDLKHMTRPILALFQGVPGAKAWRRHLSEHAHRWVAGVEVVREALEWVSESVPGAPKVCKTNGKGRKTVHVL